MNNQTTSWGSVFAGGLSALLFAALGLVWVRFALRKDPREMSKAAIVLSYGVLVVMVVIACGAIVVGIAGAVIA